MSEQNGKPKPTKRRRIRFAEDATRPSKLSKVPTKAISKGTIIEEEKWEATPANASETSLFQDASVSHEVGKFDLSEELREGKLSGEDGIIPNALVYDGGSSSSGDEIIPKKKRRNESDEDDDNNNDEQSDVLNLPDAIAAVASVLQPGQTPADVQTPAARVLASSNLADRKRENLLQLVSKWSLCWGTPGTRIHGPFTTSEMLTWARARYFCQPKRVGFVRPFGGCKWVYARDVFSSDQNK